MAASKGASRVLSMVERAKLVCWFEETNSYTQTARRFRTEFGMEPPAREQVKKWHESFLSTGSIGKRSAENGEGKAIDGKRMEGMGQEMEGMGQEMEGQLKM